MKWVLSLLFAASLTAYLFFNQPIESLTEVSQKVDRILHDAPSLPRYAEGGYSPLGRSPIVDFLLDNPLSGPSYAEDVTRVIKSNDHVAALSAALFEKGGMPPAAPFEESNSKPIPEAFKNAFTEEIGSKLHGYWTTFLSIRKEAESVLSVLSEEEKSWIRENHDKFFFGESDPKYDFFTSDSSYPLKFFELASKLDLAKLTQCAIELAGIADTFDPSGITLTDDFKWEEEGATLLISQRSGVSHEEGADFFIDLGGHNTILHNAGGTEGVRPLALHLDLKGHNTFVGKKFVQGSGFLGAGLLYSVAGNNSFTADAYSQGCGFFGSGLLVNGDGDNRFVLNFGGQSFALFGSSLLWNKAGKNDYTANQGMAQGASSTLGVAFLVDHHGENSYACGVSGSGGTTRLGGIGQGGSAGVRGNPWLNNPSFYGGLSFLYVGGGKNRFKNVWLAQGSAYFLSAGLLVAEGDDDLFEADYDAQGQGLHLAYGLLMKKGSRNRFNGGWGSLGVAGDRSVGIFIGEGEENIYQGTDQSIGTSRKPKALGCFIQIGGKNHYAFQKISNARIEFPSSPLEWSRALFLEAGSGSTFPEHVDEFKRGDNLEWGIKNYSLGASSKLLKPLLYSGLPSPSRTAYRPLPKAAPETLSASDYEARRALYEALDLARFKDRKTPQDLAYLLKNPTELDEDLFNYAIFWALRNKDKADLSEIKKALQNGALASDYSRKMAASLVGTFYTPDAEPLLVELMLHDKSDEVRYYAALALTLHNPSLVRPALSSPSEAVRYAIAKGLLENRSPDSAPLAAALFKDDSFYVRRAAGLSALSLGDKNGIPVVLETLQYETLDTTYNYGDNIYARLADYLKVDFGLDRQAWIDWWDKNKETFNFKRLE